MRAISQAGKTALQQSFTQPLYLVKLGFSVPVFLASSGEVRWDSQTWTGGVLKTVSLKEDTSGAVSGRIVVENTDGFFTAPVLNEGIQHTPVQVWMLYGNPSGEPPEYQGNDAVALLDGLIDGVSNLGDTATLEVVSTDRVQWAPRLTFTVERFSNLLPAGATINWNGQKFELKRRD